jgi:hypothetical protein
MGFDVLSAVTVKSFDPEDGGIMFLLNVGWLSPDCTALYPRIETSIETKNVYILLCS